MVCSPWLDWLPSESLRWMTATAEAAFGVIVGRSDAVGVGERPQSRPALEQALGEHAVVLRLGAFAGRVLEQRTELVLEGGGLGLVAGHGWRRPGSPRQQANSSRAIWRPCSPKVFCSPIPSLWAVKSLSRCAQQSCRRLGSR